MIAIDTNILVYAHRRDSMWFEPASRRVAEIADSGQPWAVPWPCLHEFIAIVTHPRIFSPPSTTIQARAQIDAWTESPTLALLAEGEGYWEILGELMESGKISGPRVHDARIAALCLLHGIRELWTADRDFSRVARLRTRNPLLPSSQR